MLTRNYKVALTRVRRSMLTSVNKQHPDDILDGKLVAEMVMKRLVTTSPNLTTKPCLAIIHANDRPDSLAYIKRKMTAIERLGYNYQYYKYEHGHEAKDIRERIRILNQDSQVHGIMIQSPIFDNLSISFDDLVSEICHEKDVDGLKPASLYTPCTALAVLEILDFYKIAIKNQNVLVIGRSKTVGDPIAKLLLNRGGRLTIVHRETSKDNFIQSVHQADIIVSATGVHGVIDGGMVKEGAVLIDVGISVGEDGKITGDIRHSTNRNYKYTPVPGGVGPVTVAMLMQNLLHSANLKTGFRQTTDHPLARWAAPTAADRPHLRPPPTQSLTCPDPLEPPS